MDENVVLLVEDSAKDIALVVAAFEEWGMANPVRVVKDGQEAINYLSAQGNYSNATANPRPSLVLLDLQLPKVSGLALLGWIRSHPDIGNLPVVVLTGSKRREDFEEAYQLGANACTAKTHDLAELRDLLQHLNYFSMASDYNNTAVEWFPETADPEVS